MDFPQYSDIIKPYRRRESGIKRGDLAEEFYSDRSRIVFSAAFRRLLQKAQVFPLEPNSSVRTRLTHSIEVADIGRTLALKISEALNKLGILESEFVIPVTTIVENACLLHDIGNPPFGHFGEEAIKRWFKDNYDTLIPTTGVDVGKLGVLKDDFTQFDGNPQGVRIVLRLLCENDEFGLNLSAPTILSSIKYPRSSDESAVGLHRKKQGYFQSEKEIIQQFCNGIGWNRRARFPFAYIMEAADDICYCLSDIADAFEKGIMDSEHFKRAFKICWESTTNKPLPSFLPAEDIRYFGMQLSVPLSRMFTDEACERYVQNHSALFGDGIDELIDDKGMGCVLSVLKQVARDTIYRIPQVQGSELAGYTAVRGLLDHFSALLRMSMDDFLAFVEKDAQVGKSLDLEWRLYNFLAPKYVESYQHQLKESKRDPTLEWFQRCHLLVDHISGMTDNYALTTYQMVQGISASVGGQFA